MKSSLPSGAGGGEWARIKLHLPRVESLHILFGTLLLGFQKEFSLVYLFTYSIIYRLIVFNWIFIFINITCIHNLPS